MRNVAIPALTELLANGQLSLIKNENLKEALIGYRVSKDGLQGLVEHLESVMLVLSRKYPDMIKLDYEMRYLASYKTYTNQCDFETMKQSTAFSNDLIDNAMKHGFCEVCNKAK